MRTAQTNRLPVACFAPPLTDELLARYQSLAASPPIPLDAEAQDAMKTLLACVSKWWELPESTGRVTTWPLFHLERNRTIEVEERHLTPELVKALWEVTPWMSELNRLSTAAGDGLFDRLPPGEVRDAAFHLLWHAKELTLDREPMTQDRLPAA